MYIMVRSVCENSVIQVYADYYDTRRNYIIILYRQIVVYEFVTYIIIKIKYYICALCKSAFVIISLRFAHARLKIYFIQMCRLQVQCSECLHSYTPIQNPYYCFTHDVIKIIRSFNKKTRRTRPQYKNICVYDICMYDVCTHVCMYACMFYICMWGIYLYICVYVYTHRLQDIYWIQSEGSNLLVLRYSDAFYFSFLSVIGFLPVE